MEQQKIFEEKEAPYIKDVTTEKYDNKALLNLFDKPCIIALVGDINEGKSNLVYYILSQLRDRKVFKLYTYGLRNRVQGENKIYSLTELESIKNSFIIIDELMSLWDLDNRMLKKQIENTLRLIHHNNNVLLIVAIPENIKKFVAGKINKYIFKKVTFEDFINGSSTKRIIMNYKGFENGSTLLNLDINEALIYDGHYYKIQVPYIKDKDTKKDNVKIFVQKT